MQLNVSGGEGRLLIDATRAKGLRAEFIAHAYRAAEWAGVEAPQRDAFIRDTDNPTCSIWRNIGRSVKQGRAAACLAWLDPVLGYERFVVDMGPRPDGYGCERSDATRPWGPDNAVWVP